MTSEYGTIFGIGNPLIDVVVQATDADLRALGVEKGIMHLVDEERQNEILTYFHDATPIYRPGGSAPNTLLACAGLGIPAVLSGKIGEDKFGRIYRTQVGEYGIISRLVEGNGPTGSSVILVTPDGERTMNTHLGMCQEYAVSDVDDILVSNAGFFYFTGYMWDTDSQKAAIRHALKLARENGVKVIFDVADPFAVKRYRNDFLDLITRDADVVFANQSELSLLFETKDIQAAAGELGRLAGLAAVKLGCEGSLVVENNRVEKVPSRPIKARDSTGAGDMFAAGFMVALTKGYDGRTAAEIAGYLAEEIIQLPGAQFAVSTILELRNRLPWPTGKY